MLSVSEASLPNDEIPRIRSEWHLTIILNGTVWSEESPVKWAYCEISHLRSRWQAMSFWRPQGGRISTQALAKHLYQMTRIRVYTRNLLQSVTIPTGYYHFGQQAGSASKKHFGMRKRFPSQNILFQTIWESLYKFGMVRLEKKSILCKRRKDPFSLKGPDSKQNS